VRAHPDRGADSRRGRRPPLTGFRVIVGMAALLATTTAATEISTVSSVVPTPSASAVIISRTPIGAPPPVAPAMPVPASGPGQASVANTAAPAVQAPPVRAPATSAPPGSSPSSPALAGSSPSSPGSGATPAASVAPMAKSTPVRVQIPAIQVDSTLMGLGLQNDGTMQLPPTGFPAGWYTGAPTPGELGPAIIAGHVDWGGHPGVFYDLRNLTPGAQITIARADSTTAVFRVSRVQTFPQDAFPTATVYGNLDHPGLRLITCGGSFDHAARSYVDNIIAFADLIAPHTP